MDCNITKNYLKEIKRMFEYCGNAGMVDISNCLNTAQYEKAIAIIQQWSDEHPRKTYKQDFLEKFPKSEVEEKYNYMCVDHIYGTNFNTGKYKPYCYGNHCWECWNTEMEEN